MKVTLQRTGRDAVTVKRDVRGADGHVTPKDVSVFRNRWVIEKAAFFEARAEASQLLRNETIGPRDAVRQHPELAGTYLNLRAAELASRALRDPEDQRRFVAQVRSGLAEDIERGNPCSRCGCASGVRPKWRVKSRGRKSVTLFWGVLNASRRPLGLRTLPRRDSKGLWFLVVNGGPKLHISGGRKLHT